MLAQVSTCAILLLVCISFTSIIIPSHILKIRKQKKSKQMLELANKFLDYLGGSLLS
jgi:Na+-driven multidrug efflux pump